MKIDKQAVRIGIEAPSGLSIYREEIVPLREDAEVEAEAEFETIRPRKARAA